MTGRRESHGFRAFTLVEMLVVISIILLILAILIPAINKAREVANRVQCATRLRNIGQAMVIYANDNKGAIAGSPLTTGSYLWADTSAGPKPADGINNAVAPPPCVDIYDFIGPLCSILKINLPQGDSTIERFEFYRGLEAFSCPSNRGVMAEKYVGPAGIERGQMLSYCTATGFMLQAYSGSDYSGLAAMPGTPYWTVPTNYLPLISKVGLTSRKIYAADSGRWSRYDSTPTFSLAILSDHNSTPFSDFGAFWGISKSFDRSVPNKINDATVDARVFAYRHGKRTQGGDFGEYRMNAVFFDGHVETLDDVASANPELWLPKGATISKPNGKLSSGPLIWPDAVSRYILSAPYVVP